MQPRIKVFLLRGLGVGVGAMGSIWVARALGPEKLGISTFVLSLVGLVGVLTSLNQDFRFVRDGKNLSTGQGLDKLVGQVISLRLGLVLIFLTCVIVWLLAFRPERTSLVAIAAGGLLALVQCNSAGWLLQLRNRMPRLFVATSIQSIVTGLLCIAFIRPESPAGGDLGLASIGAAVGTFLAWWWACREGVKIRISLSLFLEAFRLLRGGLWLALMGVGVYLLNSVEIPLIGALSSVEDLGIYRTAMQFINIINPFLPLFFCHLYPQLIELEKKRPNEVLTVQFAALRRLAKLGVPLIIVAFFFAPFVYPIVFGPEFASAAYPFSLLFASKILSVGVNIFMWGAFARKLDRPVVILTLTILCVSILLNILLIPRLGIIGASFVNCFVQALLLGGHIILMCYSNRKLRSH